MPSSEGELFARTLGSEWRNLHPDIRQRFGRRPYIGKPLSYTGTLDELGCSRIGRVIGWLAQPFLHGALIPICDQGVPVDIQVCTCPSSPRLYKKRIYRLNGRHAVRFTSYMLEGKKGEILEYVGFGLGMKLRLHVEGGNLHFTSDGYFWNMKLFRMPIPSILTPGTTFLSHRNEDPSRFSIRIEIRHCLFGRTFWQAGVFQEI